MLKIKDSADLQLRINKAIEYINDNGILDLNGYDLIEILKGEEDEPKEEDKKIEKLDLEDDGNTITLFGEKENEWTILDNVDIIVCNKINEIIEVINGREDN